MLYAAVALNISNIALAKIVGIQKRPFLLFTVIRLVTPAIEKCSTLENTTMGKR
jgi:hypothetical protein